jgi:hypothetical protein
MKDRVYTSGHCASTANPAKKEHCSKKIQKISECFVRLPREYTDGGTNIRSQLFDLRHSAVSPVCRPGIHG